MSNLKVSGVTPFVPAKDYELSRRFYIDLGFSEVAVGEKAVLLEIDGYGFWLQDYYVEDWAGNFMFCLYVENLEDWWSRINNMNLDEEYEKKAKVLSEPHDQEEGLMMQLADPSGVLWHIRQSK